MITTAMWRASALVYRRDNLGETACQKQQDVTSKIWAGGECNLERKTFFLCVLKACIFAVLSQVIHHMIKQIQHDSHTLPAGEMLVVFTAW